MRPFESELPQGGELQIIDHLIGLCAKLTIKPAKGNTVDWTIKLFGDFSWASIFRSNGTTHISFSSISIFDYIDEMVAKNEPGYI